MAVMKIQHLCKDIRHEHNFYTNFRLKQKHKQLWVSTASTSYIGFMTRTRDHDITEQQFWNWIKETSPTPYDGETHVENITALLSSKTPVEVLGFDFWQRWFSRLSYNTDLWCAAYILNGGCSDDGFDYFRAALIFRGEDIFKQAVAAPDSLADHWDDMQDMELEDAGYAAQDAYRSITGASMEDWYALLDDFEDPRPERKTQDFQWSEDDLESMKKITPRLVELAEFEEDD